MSEQEPRTGQPDETRSPGSSFIEPGTEDDLCRCGHVRLYHWWGGGNCGETFKNGNGCRCEYFRSGLAAAALGGVTATPKEASDG